MNVNVQFTVNGQLQRLSTDPRRTLLDVLREDLGLTGTKCGCGEGQCRACTVLLDGSPVRSCLTEITEVEGRKVESIEGLGRNGRLHPVQEAFIQEGAMQCGYCVPGMIVATVGLLRRNPKPTQTQILDALNGNLCRCCGYGNILKAVQRAVRSVAPAESATSSRTGNPK
ncbi:MAG: (2Fe-2S)-binding protein [Verrucomicrobia bacterium]|nr:(2Fe-2S)-binding protein [Verrucomicrobiota bacterium]